jgi:nickel-dependent lactate racemase
MAHVIKVPQLAWYGPGDFEIILPDLWQVEVCHMAGCNRPALDDNAIRDIITHPIESSPLRELAADRHEVVIIFDDTTRVTRTARIMPYILEELAEAGIPDDHIRFIAATGAHAPMDRNGFVKKLGESIVARFPVYNHNAYENCAYAGTTSHGTKVYVNAEFLHCDLKISVSSVTPHLFSVYSGGGKMVMPGVSSIDTIAQNHGISITQDERDNYSINPIRMDLEEAARLVGLDWIVESIVDRWGEAVALYAGAPEPAYAACIRDAGQHYRTAKAENRDIVIANSYAKATEAATSLKMAASVSRSGGDLVIIANAPEGQVVHYLSGPWGRTLWGRQPLLFPIPANVNHLILFTEYPDICGTQMYSPQEKIVPLYKWEDVVNRLRESHGDNATVAVYPYADIQMLA